MKDERMKDEREKNEREKNERENPDSYREKDERLQTSNFFPPIAIGAIGIQTSNFKLLISKKIFNFKIFKLTYGNASCLDGR
jgi:hypothetical protein